ncbi:hypothetical protein THAOC_32272 [Thalassiosira oceanica]|uniref:Uncharacterized protein n=1 Tax=Thalassiosira oceanica TaxID=159749 RepID=K0R7I6_THAOC|nr:hypothetical protein THAOC_32272 [Thalassiosira oceanica]|eukprot:EJK48895.1 hypothetical protein THAOC_32272 [Thalassiosira oceanica]
MVAFILIYPLAGVPASTRLRGATGASSTRGAIGAPSPASLPTLQMSSQFEYIEQIDQATIQIPILVAASFLLFFSAQTFINTLLSGDRGLGSYLSDGGGYGRSGFVPRRKGEDASDAPLSGPDLLPWLKLPEFDYVEVKGQPINPTRNTFPETGSDELSSDKSDVLVELELMRDQLRVKVEDGDMLAAKKIEDRLRELMKREGFEYENTNQRMDVSKK